MKKSTSECSHSKPPPVRNYLCAKPTVRYPTPFGVERSPFHLPVHPHTDRLVSMSENPEIQDSVANITVLHASSKEVTDCMSGWLAFMQMLKGVCSTGAQLSNSLGALVCQSAACKARAAQCQLMWDQLSHATSAATALVKNQTVAALQEVHIPNDIDADQVDINQQVVCSGLVTMINLQYQFSMACCERLGHLAECQCYPPHSEPNCEAVTRCYSSRLPPPIQPPARRWSEAAGGREKANDSTLRRWSMPWKLVLPSSTATGDRSRSITPADSVWHTALASQDELQDVISLLSVRPPPPLAQPLPGVTLTEAPDGGSGSGTDPSPRGSFTPRGSWWGGLEDELNVGMLASRKSSSSTDSSSCYSIHSRSTSGSASEELTHGQRSHLYSMWSGGDLPFIKLPESSENTET